MEWGFGERFRREEKGSLGEVLQKRGFIGVREEGVFAGKDLTGTQRI